MPNDMPSLHIGSKTSFLFSTPNPFCFVLAPPTNLVTEQLFQAAMQIAKPAEKEDPTKQKRVWRFGNL